MPLTGTHAVGDSGHVTDHNLIDNAITALQALVPTAPILKALVTAKGDVIAGTASGTVDNLAVGTDGQALVADSTQTMGIKWGSSTDAGALHTSTATAKGDTFAASAASTVARVPVGSDGTVLTADSSQALGIKWGTTLALTTSAPANLDATAANGTGTTAAKSNHVHSKAGITNAAVPRPESGAFVVPANTNTSTQGGYAGATMYLSAIDVAVSTSFTVIATFITAVGTGAGQVIRMGIYADDGTYARPTGAPTLDAGTVSSIGSTGELDISITQTLAPGRWWLAWVLQGTVTTSPTVVTLNTINQLGLASLANNSHRVWCQASVSGALPSIGTLFRNPAPPMVGLKVA